MPALSKGLLWDIVISHRVVCRQDKEQFLRQKEFEKGRETVVKKKMEKVLAIILLAILTVVSVAGCGQTVKESNTEAEESDAVQIGFSMDSFLIERWQRDRDIFVSKAQELGAEVNVQNANGEVSRQISQIEYFIEKDMDVIVIVAIDGGALGEVVEKAKKAGIKVIAYDRLILNADVDLYISFDNEKVGTLMGELLREALGDEGNIICINGSPTDNNVKLVFGGFKEALQGSDIRIDRTGYADNWLAEIGFEFVSEYLAEGYVPDAIMCGNDDIATQVVKALSENRLAGQVYVTGQDADLAACQRIVEGTQYMTVYKPLELLAQRAAEMAVALAEGEIPETQSLINNGTYDIPFEKLEPVAVTKENMDEVIIGKYHQKNEVYLNVQE